MKAGGVPGEGGLSYAAAGVDYDRLDAFKRACQAAAAGTRAALAGSGWAEPAAVRGESAYLLEGPEHYLAHVEEGLGTKNLVAAAVGGAEAWRAIGIDTVATIVNDLVTCGARPLSVAMHAAVGDDGWFADAGRAAALAAGFAEGCRQAGAVWGGGETPTLRGVVEPDAILLGGSAVGIIAPKGRRIAGDVAAGDVLVFLASSGVHTNGLTLCRRLAERLPAGYATPLEDGTPYGAALLAPSVLYARFVRDCQEAGVALRYVAHVTGHGWRKLMRLEAPLVHVVTDPRPAPPLFRFLMERGPVSAREAYGTFNMGVGFAAWVRPAEAARTVAVARAGGYDAWVAGEVRAGANGRRAVEVPSLGLVFEGDTLRLR